eukprot:11041065-Alexandrium_andersonii.AAC.1
MHALVLDASDVGGRSAAASRVLSRDACLCRCHARALMHTCLSRCIFPAMALVLAQCCAASSADLRIRYS